MTQKNAQIIFIAFNLIAAFLVVYIINDFVSISSALIDKEKTIPFDSGIYYFLLMTVFWVFSFIQYAGLKCKESKVLKYANQIAIVWFVLMLILANLIPYYLSNNMETSGYVKCDDPSEISRVVKGESSLYKLDGCL